MDKFFLQHIIPSLDKATIASEGIASVELMERAAQTVAQWITDRLAVGEAVVMTGPGNNGGDGLAVARMLSAAGWTIRTFLYTNESGKLSDDNAANLQRLREQGIEVGINAPLPSIGENQIVVDALFGTGLSRPLDSRWQHIINHINASGATVVSIDLPSGIGREDAPMQQHIIRATHTISFQFPKLAFMLPEYSQYVGHWHITDIGLDANAIAATESHLYINSEHCAAALLKQRDRFAHKGTFGRAQMICGNYGMMGAATMAAKACMRSGAGLLQMIVPKCGYQIMQCSVPEAMAATAGDNNIKWTDSLADDRISTIGIGPGLGRSHDAQRAVTQVLIRYADKPMVIDADGLYALGPILETGAAMPHRCILTPHVGEFDRLTHTHDTHLARLETARAFAERYKTTIVLKGANTAIATPDGRLTFNTTGNPGMATAGSGDVLAGLITGLLAQGYTEYEAATLGVYLHGLAGDIAAQKLSEEAMTAMDICNHIGEAYKRLHKAKTESPLTGNRQ